MTRRVFQDLLSTCDFLFFFYQVYICGKIKSGKVVDTVINFSSDDWISRTPWGFIFSLEIIISIIIPLFSTLARSNFFLLNFNILLFMFLNNKQTT